MTKSLPVLLVALTLAMLLPICEHAYAASDPDTSRVWVPSSLLRDATTRIDMLDWEVATLRARRAESDSLWADRVRYYRELSAAWEHDARAWWPKHESAFWAVLGMAAAAFALQ